MVAAPRIRLAVAALGAAALALLPPALPSPAAEEAWVVESEGWTLRDGPKLGARPVGSVRVGEKVRVLGRAPGWVRVEAGDRTGWVTESGVGAEPPASLQLEPLRERLASLEQGSAGLENEREALQVENLRLGTRVGELEQSLARARKEAVDARSSGRLGVLALGGGLVIAGWVAGYAYAALRRRSAARYTIG